MKRLGGDVGISTKKNLKPGRIKVVMLRRHAMVTVHRYIILFFKRRFHKKFTLAKKSVSTLLSE